MPAPKRTPVTPGPRLLPALAAALLMLAAPVPADAQVLTGKLVEEGSETPVVGALIVAVDSTGSSRGETLTRGDGTYVLRLPVAGTYRVEVQRIGIRSRTSEPVVVPLEPSAYLLLEAGQEAVRLEGISVTSEPRCRLASEAAEDVARVWEEVRKALETAAVAGRENLLTYEIERSRRTLRAEDLGLVEGTTSRQTVRGERPFRSIDAGELEREGFIRREAGGFSYFAPDAEVLLSAPFLDTHCLRLAEADDASRIAVEFQPVAGRAVADIRGRMVVDRATGVLERIDFRYVHSPLPAGNGVDGGSIRFVRAPNGVWVPADWHIRMTTVVRQGPRLEGRDVSELVPVELLETGGRVLSVRDGRGERWSLSGSATLEGRVLAADGGALPGARIRVEGTAYATVADDEGRYRLSGLAAGRYTLRAWHPALDSLPWPDEPSVAVELDEGAAVRLDVPVPSREAMVRTACRGYGIRGEEELESEPRAVFGVVRNEAGAPVTGADVTVAWGAWDLRAGVGSGTVVRQRGNAATVASDARGRFLVCGLPGGTRLTVRAEVGDQGSGEVTVEAGTHLARTDLIVGGS